ncbi:helix-turn-helix transcriptional regulator [Ekhidna sp.]|uniref:helix-turn-helix transcriptional regulator n=1 Tax=Ekhidna sp. TaxID=2608089 RepID=UPI0035112B24
MSKDLIRFWAYDRCLTNPVKKYTWDELLERANEDLEEQGFKPIKKTQFYNDIKTLKRPPHLAPIDTFKEEGKSYYYYTDPDYSFRKQGLNELEAEQIKSALMILSRFKGMPQFEWVHEIIPKIEKEFGLDDKTNDVIGFDQNVDLKGMEHFGGLFNSILYHQVLSVKYKSFKHKEPVKMIIHPYYLKQFNNRWFLFGHNQELATLSNLPLDRIIDFNQVEDETYIGNNWDFEEYFDDMIGVTKTDGETSMNIKLWFSKDQAPYIDTKPLHLTQKLDWLEDGSAEVRIEVIPNIELEQVILRYGEHCIVLEPESLRKKIANRINCTVDNYK